MKNFKKIAGINLGLLLVYTVLVNLNFTGRERDLGVLVVMAFVIGGHVLLNMIISIINFLNKNNDLGKTYLLNAGLVLLIGFSSCWGGVLLPIK